MPHRHDEDLAKLTIISGNAGDRVYTSALSVKAGGWGDLALRLRLMSLLSSLVIHPVQWR
ncbi:MAG: hypothetical protein Alpg2KO_10010 [Alphaproteobacteria bacterium]